MFDDLNSQPNNQGQDNNRPAGLEPPRPPQNLQNAPFASQTEPEDIFSGTDKTMAHQQKPPQFQPKPNNYQFGQASAGSAPDREAQNTPLASSASASGRQNRRYIVIGVIAIAALAVILLSMIALAYFKYQSAGDAEILDSNAGGTKSLNTDEAADEAINEDIEAFDAENKADADNLSNDAQDVSGGSEAVDALDTEIDKVDEKSEFILDEITDSDNDGLTDGEEKRLGTDINSSDTDGDGLFDRQEVRIYNTDPLNSDTDGDGYLDGNEVNNGYNPKGEGKLYELP